MTDPTIQRATCAAVLDVLARTEPHTTAAASHHVESALPEADVVRPFDRFTSQPPTPPSAVDAVLAWCARELDRVGVP
jgi:hypothetical protein